MKIKETLIKIFRENRSVFVMMLLVLLFALALLILSLVLIDSGKAVVKTGYGDIGGYRDGAWSDLITFPLLAIIFGGLHNLLAMKVYEKNGAPLAKIFLGLTLFLIVGAMIVIVRLSRGV